MSEIVTTQPEGSRGSILICHSVDLDGISCVIFAKRFGGFDRILPQNYDFETIPEVRSEILKYQKVIMADLSCSEGFFRELRALGKDVRIFDHHVSEKTAWIPTYEGNVQDESRCGSRLLLEEYYKQSRFHPAVADYRLLVDTYDLFKTDSPYWEEAKNLNRVFFGHAAYKLEDPIDKHSTFIRTAITKFSLNRRWQWTQSEENLILRAKAREIEALEEATKSLRIRRSASGHLFGVMKFGAKISLVCNKLLKESTLKGKIAYFLVVNDYQGKVGHISGRSGDPNTFLIPHLNPFNGHPLAAACDVDEETALRLYYEPVAFRLKADIGEDDHELFESAEPVQIDYQIFFKEGQYGL